jgi:anti-sigma regulatory factor (Ser/Thr protein kinase)
VLVRELAEPSAVSLARGVLTRFAERSGAPESVCSALATAVTEACANVVSHAYLGRDVPGRLEVRACVEDAVLVVEVADEGRGMVARVDSPGLGLGLPLIAQTADVFEILDRVEPAGVVLRMRFALAGTHGVRAGPASRSWRWRLGERVNVTTGGHGVDHNVFDTPSANNVVGAIFDAGRGLVFRGARRVGRTRGATHRASDY